MDMTPVLTQMGILVFIMAVGFFCTKIGLTGPEFTHSTAKVVMNVLLVFTILDSVVSAELELSIADVGSDILAYFVMVIISSALGFITAKLIGGRSDRRGISVFAIAFANTVFVGFPVVESIYGPEGILIATLSNVPFNMLVYTIGIAMINGSTRGMNIKSAISAPLVATVLAIAFFLMDIELPMPVVQCFDTLGSGTVPMSMLVVGASLGSISVKSALSDWRVYVVSFMRLIVSPLIVYFVLRLFVHDEALLGIATVLSACPAAMIATALAINAQKDEAYASQCIFVSTALSAVTMPLMIWLLL